MVITFAEANGFESLQDTYQPTKELLLQRHSCGADGRADASNTRDPRFESQHCCNIKCIYQLNAVEKTKIKKMDWERLSFNFQMKLVNSVVEKIKL